MDRCLTGAVREKGEWKGAGERPAHLLRWRFCLPSWKQRPRPALQKSIACSTALFRHLFALYVCSCRWDTRRLFPTTTSNCFHRHGQCQCRPICVGTIFVGGMQVSRMNWQDNPLKVYQIKFCVMKSQNHARFKIVHHSIPAYQELRVRLRLALDPALDTNGGGSLFCNGVGDLWDIHMYEIWHVLAGVRFACVSDVHVCENFKCATFSHMWDFQICEIFIWAKYLHLSGFKRGRSPIRERLWYMSDFTCVRFSFALYRHVCEIFK